MVQAPPPTSLAPVEAAVAARLVADTRRQITAWVDRIRDHGIPLLGMLGAVLDRARPADQRDPPPDDPAG